MTEILVPTHKYGQFEEMYRKYRDELVPLEYEFLVKFGEVALREGYPRRAIEVTREALVHAKDANDQASVYIFLSRAYRMMIQMQNARSELRRAFQVLGTPYPHLGLWGFLSSLTAIALPIFITKARRTSYSLNVQKKMELLVSLYEEAGLSNYYMRNSALSFLQISFAARKVVRKLGLSIELVDYLAATATAFGIFKMNRLANHYLNKAKNASELLADPKATAKYREWEVLMVSYLGDTVRSAHLAEQLLLDQKEDVSPYSLRLLATTLSLNYTIRGNTRSALAAIDQIYTAHDRVDTRKIFSSTKTFVEWYNIPALSFHGETAELERIIKNSRAIFSAIDEEKWQITLYLGNILIHFYLAPTHNMKEIANVFDRFDSIALSPKMTFLEARHYWIARAYLLLDLTYTGDASLQEAEKGIRDLRALGPHPVSRSHYHVLAAHLALIKGFKSACRSHIVTARELARTIDNEWVAYEADKLSLLLLCISGEAALAGQEYERLANELRERGWNGCVTKLDSIVHHYTKT